MPAAQRRLPAGSTIPCVHPDEPYPVGEHPPGGAVRPPPRFGIFSLHRFFRDLPPKISEGYIAPQLTGLQP